MKININDYLTEEEIKEIVIEEFRNSIRENIRNERNFTRILTNISYYELWKVIEEEIPNYKKDIIEEVKDRLKDITKFDIFRRKNEIGIENNTIAQDILEKCVLSNQNIIENKVKEILNEVNKTDLKYEIQSIIEEYFEKLLKPDMNGEEKNV